MKNFLKKGIVALSVLLLLTTGFTMTIHAAGKIPTKCRGYANSAWASVNIPLEKEQYIKITSSKGLTTKVTYENYSSYSDTSSASIGYYTTKEGKYTIKFNVYNANTNKKVSSHTLTAYIYNDSPIQNLLIDGKSFTSIVSKSAVTVKVTMNKGYKLRKIEYGVYGKPVKTESGEENSMTYKKFKNGSKITLGKNTHYYLNDTSSETYRYHFMNTTLFPQTEIVITYVDKYTGLEGTSSYTIYKVS
jgi:hypothetical protein